jgi:hypothetical protein
MMNSNTLKDLLCRALREKSGLDEYRPYLGMSGIGQCPRKLYFDFADGRQPPTDQQHWYCWTGYLHEAAVLGLLGEALTPALSHTPSGAPKGGGEREEEKMLRQVEVVASFDERFRGHVDWVMGEQVIEIKSVGWDKFVKIQGNGRPQYEHRCQVQCYLRHGGWQKAYVVYIARDVPHKEFEGPPFWVFEVERDEGLMEQMDTKAKQILAAIDAGEPPACTCGWCGR